MPSVEKKKNLLLLNRFDYIFLRLSAFFLLQPLLGECHTGNMVCPGAAAGHKPSKGAGLASTVT